MPFGHRTGEEIRRAEFEAGRRAAERAQRLALFERYMKIPNFRYVICLSGHKYWRRGEYNIVVSVLDEEIWHGDKDARGFPPPELMAQLGLAAAALGLALPQAEPTHKVSEGGKAYNLRLREQNAARWGDHETDKNT